MVSSTWSVTLTQITPIESFSGNGKHASRRQMIQYHEEDTIIVVRMGRVGEVPVKILEHSVKRYVLVSEVFGAYDFSNDSHSTAIE